MKNKIKAAGKIESNSWKKNEFSFVAMVPGIAIYLYQNKKPWLIKVKSWMFENNHSLTSIFFSNLNIYC